VPGSSEEKEGGVAVNDQYNEPLFGVSPGGFTSTGAAGSPPASGGPPGAADVMITDPTGSARVSAIGSHGQAQPGQLTEGISGITAVETGAGQGSTIARHPNSTARA
jgi:hypothetical protein